jgi:hypothetical protein
MRSELFYQLQLLGLVVLMLVSRSEQQFSSSSSLATYQVYVSGQLASVIVDKMKPNSDMKYPLCDLTACSSTSVGNYCVYSVYTNVYYADLCQCVQLGANPSFNYAWDCDY